MASFGERLFHLTRHWRTLDRCDFGLRSDFFSRFFVRFSLFRSWRGPYSADRNEKLRTGWSSMRKFASYTRQLWVIFNIFDIRFFSSEARKFMVWNTKEDNESNWRGRSDVYRWMLWVSCIWRYGSIRKSTIGFFENSRMRVVESLDNES